MSTVHSCYFPVQDDVVVAKSDIYVDVCGEQAIKV